MLNGHACRRWLAITLFGLTLPMLSACDNTPNPKFEQELRARQSGAEDDFYASLSGAPRIQSFARWKQGQLRARANLEAQNFADTYESMLAQLDTETVGAGMEGIFAVCRTAFAQALNYQRQGIAKLDATTAVLDGAAIFNDLQRCREQAQQPGKAGDEQTELLGSTLRRFSSAGMVLIGISMMAQGDEPAGLKLWKASDGLLDEDRAGFKLSLRAFRGY